MSAKQTINADKGGYVLADDADFEVIIIATGSEVEIALQAKTMLNEKGTKVRVVSMPCMEIFEEQSQTYRESVLPGSCLKRVAIEAGASQSWHKYVGFDGRIIGLDRFGASAPYKEIYTQLGITADNLVSKVEEIL